MRPIRIFILCLLVISSRGFSQNIIDQDQVLKNIRTQLPEGWSMSTVNNRIIFTRKDSVWTKFVNKINQQANAKKPNAEERIASFKKEGKRTLCMLSYRYENRWTKSALKKAEEQNQKVFNTISKLPSKYKIENLFDSLSTKDHHGHDYIPKTEADKAQIGKYEDEKDKLMRTLIKIPFLNTEKYSLFTDTSSGYEDAFTDVYPEQASMEWYKVQGTVNSLCSANNDQKTE